MPAFFVMIIFGVMLSGCFTHSLYTDTYSPQLTGNIQSDFIALDDFNRVKISGSFSASFVPDTEHSVTVTADENILEYISIITDGEEIEIRFNRNLRNVSNVELEIRSPKLSSVITSGSVSAVFNDIQSDSMRIRASGSGRFSGTGSFNVLNINTSGSASVAGENLVANQVIIRSSGSSRMVVHALDEISARISGSGTITYHGNPAIIDNRVSGSGIIRKAQ